MGSGISFPVILKPGASGTFNSYSPTKDLQLLQGKGKMVYAEVTGQIVRTGGFFHSYSAPFTISPNLITPPWSDLGEKDYLAVAPDLEHIFFSAPMTAEDKTRDPTWSAGPAVTIEVKITNTTGQSIIAANDSIVFYVERGAAIRKAPSQWETIRPPGRLLMPGASTLSTGRCYINWIDWAEMNYKSGDKIVAAVGGRIPNTNQIFECYSAPFELPPLPNPHPTPKPAFSIPGIQ